MTDTVTVALIAVAGTLTSGLLSYYASRRNTAAQLAGIDVESRKLSTTRTERVRLERAEIYTEFLSAADDIEDQQRSLHRPFDTKDYAASISILMKLYNRILLVGDDTVAQPAAGLLQVVGFFARTVAESANQDPDASAVVHTKAAMKKIGPEWHAKRDVLRAVMRADLEDLERH